VVKPGQSSAELGTGFVRICAVLEPNKTMRRSIPLILLCLSVACAGGPKEHLGPGVLDDVPPLRGLQPLATDFDVEHYVLELRLDPGRRRIDGTCRVRLFPLVEGLRTVNLDLVELEVESVQNAAGTDLDFAHFDDRLRIELETPAPRGRAVELSIRYGGSPRKGLWFAGGDPPTHVFTQGECEDARWWFPCQDHPSERATSELILDLPAGWSSVAAGELIESREVDGRRFDRWRMHAPHPAYLETLVAGELSEVRGEWEGLPLTFHAPPAFADRLESSLAATDDALGFLSRLTGRRYPYAKYATACVQNFPFGGMENISATTLGVAALREARGLADRDADSLVVHEAAHQWFGDLLTCADWSEVWLNEGFATYCGQLWTEETEGSEAFQLAMDDTIEAYLHGDSESPRPLVYGRCRAPIDLFFGGHVYAGGASRLHLLRHVLGDQAFFAGVRRYVGENAGRSVVSADLRAAMERASGQDLELFFEQWVLSPGHPQLDVSWTYDSERARVLLTVNQAHDLTPGVPEVFEMPLEVELAVGDTVRRQRLELTGRRELFELLADEAPRWVLADPDRWLPARLRSRKDASEWLAIAEGAGPVGRRRAMIALASAARALKGEARAACGEALASRLAGDGRPEVRAEAARALGRLGGKLAREALLSAAVGDATPAVRVAALEALTAVGVDAEVAELGRSAVQESLSWNVVAAGARLVARAEPDGAAAWLEAQLSASDPGLHGQPHASLLPALVDAAGIKARARLLAFAQDPLASEPLRVVAVSQLGHLAAGDPELVAALGRLLRSNLGRLRGEAVRALVRAGDPDAHRILIAYYPSCVSPFERRAIEQALQH
jgi:aminopeptidase N